MRQIEGQQLENAVKEACEHYCAADLAWIEKVPTPFQQVGGAAGSRFRGVYTERSQCDFAGFFSCSDRVSAVLRGRAVVVECKATDKATLPLSHIRPKQQQWLEAAPHGFVLVYFTTLGKCRLFRWSPGKSRGSLKPTDGFEVAAARFLDPILALWAAPATEGGTKC